MTDHGVPFESPSPRPAQRNAQILDAVGAARLPAHAQAAEQVEVDEQVPRRLTPQA
ncbi:MAG: hypothetical protein ACOH2F_16055 [Cellulomonas sp.]